MDNSSRFFEHRECDYYPCHQGIEELNCLFCYCPMYHLDRCPGEPKYKVRDGKTIKVCTGCTFPHRAENYDRIMEMIRK